MIQIGLLFLTLLTVGFFVIKNTENNEDDDMNFGC